MHMPKRPRARFKGHRCNLGWTISAAATVCYEVVPVKILGAPDCRGRSPMFSIVKLVCSLLIDALLRIISQRTFRMLPIPNLGIYDSSA